MLEINHKQHLYLLSILGLIPISFFIKNIFKQKPINSLSGRKNIGVVVTGGSSGFGEALIREFLKEGHRVATCSRSPLSKELQQESCFWKKTDLTSPSESQEFISFAQEKLGTIDVFILNAITVEHDVINQKFHETTDKSTRLMLDVGLTSYISLTHEVIPIMLKQKFGGHVVFVQGLRCDGRIQKGFTVIGTTKYALSYFQKSLVSEYSDSAIGFHSINPGMLINTQPFEKMVMFRKMANIMGITPAGTAARMVLPHIMNLEGTNKNYHRMNFLSIEAIYSLNLRVNFSLVSVKVFLKFVILDCTLKIIF